MSRYQNLAPYLDPLVYIVKLLLQFKILNLRGQRYCLWKLEVGLMSVGQVWMRVVRPGVVRSGVVRSGVVRPGVVRPGVVALAN